MTMQGEAAKMAVSLRVFSLRRCFLFYSSPIMILNPMSELYAGQLLVASPSVVDPLFGRSVCLVMHHDADGAIGVLLNRPLQIGPNQLFQMLDSENASDSRLPTNPPRRAVHFGGPMAGPVVALHNQQGLAEAVTGSGVYLAAQKEHLQALVKTDTTASMRLIVGHAAWKSGQLEAEIEAGLWYLLPATADRVFKADDSMWAHLVRTGVGHSLASWVGVDDTRINPSLN
jgi:putative transcriptional regulator